MPEEVCGSCCTELITTEYCRRLEDDVLWTHVIREALWSCQRERAIPEELSSIASPFKGPREPDPAGLQLYSDEIGTVPAWMTWASQWLPFRWP